MRAVAENGNMTTMRRVERLLLGLITELRNAGIIIPILTSHAQEGHNDEETKGAVSALIAGLFLVSVSSLREYAAIKEPAEGFLEACQCSEDVGDLGGSEVRKREENADD